MLFGVEFGPIVPWESAPMFFGPAGRQVANLLIGRLWKDGVPHAV